MVLFIHRSQDSSVDLEIDTTGVHPPLGETASVVFHVLIPTSIWGWNENCCVFLRFGHSKLGKWKENIGDFVFVR